MDEMDICTNEEPDDCSTSPPISNLEISIDVPLSTDSSNQGPSMSTSITHYQPQLQTNIAISPITEEDGTNWESEPTKEVLTYANVCTETTGECYTSSLARALHQVLGPSNDLLQLDRCRKQLKVLRPIPLDSRQTHKYLMRKLKSQLFKLKVDIKKELDRLIQANISEKDLSTKNHDIYKAVEKYLEEL